jgi:predicted dehydrogenase
VSHREVAESLLLAGIDVLVEKPLTASLADADAIIATAEKVGKLVMVGHTERFNPAIEALSDHVQAPQFLEIHRLAAFSARSTDIDVVLDLMIHDLDLLLNLDGTDAVSVDAVGIAALTGKVDIANARVRMASGCIANVTASRISVEPLRRLRIFQAQTYLSCDTGKQLVERFKLDRSSEASPQILYDKLPIKDGEPLANELNAFLEAVRTRSRPRVNGHDGRRALALAHTVLASIKEHRERN